MRVILVDDAPLVREGIARLLADDGVDVVAQLSDATALADAVDAYAPDAVVLDVRMPPTHTSEGLQAALELKRAHPGVGVLVLSQHVETRHAVELLKGGTAGVGYLLKERIARSTELVDALKFRRHPGHGRRSRSDPPPRRLSHRLVGLRWPVSPTGRRTRPHGIRVAWLLSPGSPHPSIPPEHDPEATETLLHRRPRLDDVGNVAAFLASNRAPTMTATEVNITGGEVVD